MVCLARVATKDLGLRALLQKAKTPAGMLAVRDERHNFTQKLLYARSNFCQAKTHGLCVVRACSAQARVGDPIRREQSLRQGRGSVSCSFLWRVSDLR